MGHGMHDYSFYSAILGLSSDWRISNVTLDAPSGNIELHIRYANDSKFSCAICGAILLPKGTRMARWLHGKNDKLRFSISAVIPLVSCEQCGEDKIKLPWEKSGFTCDEKTCCSKEKH